MQDEARPILEFPFDQSADPNGFIRAAMDWHFSPETGSPFWLKRARSLEFDPRTDVRGFEDLTMFPTVTDELRDVRVQDLIPRGYGANPEIVGVFESGGTTGPPKRIAMLRDWWDLRLEWEISGFDAHGVPRNVNSLDLFPSGPHMAGTLARRYAEVVGGLVFTIDIDPRWMKRLVAMGKADEADAYAEHLIDQAALVLRTQDIGTLRLTPPLLERLARRDQLVELVRASVQAIVWSGAHMDSDTRHLLRSEVFPGVTLIGAYGNTMMLSGALERACLTIADPCIFDSFSPYVTFSVLDPDKRSVVPYGQRGQVVTNHVSRSFLLPNNLERDLATRVQPRESQLGDSIADVAPVSRFDDETVIEGVY